MEARCTPAALTMMPSIQQRSEQQHRRMCPQLDPLPVERDAAPSIRPRPQQRERGPLPALLPHQPVGNGVRLKREPWFRQKAFHLHFFNIFFSRATARSPQNARALRGSRPSRVWPGAGADGTSLSYFAVAIPTKPFPHTSELVLMAQQQLPQCTRTTYACMGG